MPLEKLKLRKTDYILVTNRLKIIELVPFISSLEDKGLQFQMADGISDNLIYLKIHIPSFIFYHYALVYDLNVLQRKHCLTKKKKMGPLDVYKEDGIPTTAEKIYVVQNLLEDSRFTNGESVITFEKLIHMRLIIAAYPLHDGTDDWRHTTRVLNDRQLLLKHWANLGVWYKEQPLDLIEKYFGPEVAFYFAWLGFFNKMLISASFVGLGVFLIGAFLFISIRIPEVHEVCDNNSQMFCPKCNEPEYCNFVPLSSACSNARAGYVFDNEWTLVFSIFMAFWARIYLILWARNESVLKYRWGVEATELDTEYRLEYVEGTELRKINIYSGKEEPYYSNRDKFCGIAITISIVFLLIILVFIAVTGVIYYKILSHHLMDFSDYEFLEKHSSNIATVTGSLLQVIFIKIFGKYYGRISFWLTDIENPRTQSEYDKSFLYKKFILYFVNYYSVFFYLAFLKGRFFNSPKGMENTNIFERDVCVINCIAYLNVQIVFLMIFKRMLGNIIVLMTPSVKQFFRFRGRRNLDDIPVEELPQWEKELALEEYDEHHVMLETCEMIIEYGFVTFFVAAFPLAPLCALFNNTFELRMDAYKLVSNMRRPVMKRVPGIGSWNGILLGMTYLSVITNAFLVAFTSNFVPKVVYKKAHKGRLEGYINSTLSLFKVKDAHLYQQIDKKDVPEFCYYESKRFPPGHHNEYQHTQDYWIDLTWRLLLVFIFEHVIMILTAGVACLIPEVPFSVKAQYYANYNRKQKLKMNRLQKRKFELDEKNMHLSNEDIMELIMNPERRDSPAMNFIMQEEKEASLSDFEANNKEFSEVQNSVIRKSITPDIALPISPQFPVNMPVENNSANNDNEKPLEKVKNDTVQVNLPKTDVKEQAINVPENTHRDDPDTEYLNYVQIGPFG